MLKWSRRAWLGAWTLNWEGTAEAQPTGHTPYCGAAGPCNPLGESCLQEWLAAARPTGE